MRRKDRYDIADLEENQFEPGSTFFHRAMKLPHSSSGSLVVPFCVECTCKKTSGTREFQGLMRYRVRARWSIT